MSPFQQPKYVWIKTQDGSPTLWNNDVGEPYRSVKGAFQESLIVFVKPAIEFAQKLLQTGKKEIIVAEFGLGAGTNWIFWSTLAKHFQIPFRYYAIEKDPLAFQMALEKWESEAPLIISSIQKYLGVHCSFEMKSFARPFIFPSVEDMLSGFDSLNLDADVWFHDPFGYGVNPEGYTESTLQKCAALWASPFLGLSYACNSSFQKKLRDLGMQTISEELNSPPLKKEALRFFNQPL